MPIQAHMDCPLATLILFYRINNVTQPIENMPLFCQLHYPKIAQNI